MPAPPPPSAHQAASPRCWSVCATPRTTLRLLSTWWRRRFGGETQLLSARGRSAVAAQPPSSLSPAEESAHQPLLRQRPHAADAPALWLLQVREKVQAAADHMREPHEFKG